VTASLQFISELYQKHRSFQELTEYILQNKSRRFVLKGLSGSSSSLVTSTVLRTVSQVHFIILSEKEEAAYFYDDLTHCLNETDVLFFPSSYRRSIQYGQLDNGQIILRAKTLCRLNEYTEGLLAIVTYPEALFEKVNSKEFLEGNTLHMNVGEKISIEFIREVLETYLFEEVDFVYEPGQFAVRGSILDIFSFAAEHPYRIDFFGDEVESIRSFDTENQLSLEKFDRVEVVQNLNNQNIKDKFLPIINYGGLCSSLWSNNFQLVANRLEEIYTSILNNNISLHERMYLKDEFIADLAQYRTVEIEGKSMFPEAVGFQFHTSPQPRFQKNFNLLGDDIKRHSSEGYNTLLFAENQNQIERLRAIFKDTHPNLTFEEVPQIIHEGFIDSDLKLCCYTDHQIFDRYHKYRLQQYYSNKASVSLNEIRDLKPGDYVVHIDHGIGRFGGLEKITTNGRTQEAVRLVYKDNDILYVNIHSLHRISKYKGKDDSEPRIYKLGSGAWQKLKENTKKKVKDIAKDLIALYAIRKAKEGFQFSADTYLQEELEASFIYEDTPDQVTSTKTVKSDMESKVPMDRLICGDVGFGKTEVAIRAAFKAVADSKQVAILVPTTLLAFQHYNTFRDRLKDFPCTIEYISRLRKVSDQKRILRDVGTGRVDILIGTHRLLGKDIQFKDLGLLVIDEEQKFGVVSKEKLRNFKTHVDTLTLTATPIPRTLQFSLLGARDLSVINTPPPNRHPIVTELHTFNEEIIREGIQFEVSRGGQVFFIHNRIQNISEVEMLIKKLCPDVRTVVGHGQMEGSRLEQIMIDFINGDYDVLVATAIIESGLDIPNANTIFINNAHNFGLSDLHQLRGRVGRSNRRAFCYLIAPPLTSLTPEAKRRLKAIEELSDLGSGFNIALQDLDIRGAGNMLGAEQSGFIADIGFDAYNRILNEAIQELKENEFKEIYAARGIESHEERNMSEGEKYYTDCIIETDMEVHIPDTYISNVTERIKTYQEIDSIKDESMLHELKVNLADRFGPLPGSLIDLLKIVETRWLAEILGFEKLVLKNNRMTAYFISDKNSKYYRSQTFGKILNFVKCNPDTFRMKEGEGKLSLTASPMEEIDKVHALLLLLKNNSCPE
jgi:transcription-repair coupling factor (superfamily II helicase)